LDELSGNFRMQIWPSSGILAAFMNEKVITVRDICKNFGKVEAVRNLSFEVEKASCFGFLGPNGAGKTTMMKMIYGKCTRNVNCDGHMSIFGFDPRNHELEIKYLSGVVPQDDNLDDELNVRQNLMIYARFYQMPAKVVKERIDFLLEFLELSEKAGSKIRELSGGMKRRLVIARALLNNPRLLILDEPTTGLDPQVRLLIWEKLNHLKKEGTTILLTTHYMEEAFQICDTVLIMHKGQKLMEGNPLDLLEQNIERYVLEVPAGESLSDLSEAGFGGGIRVDKSHEAARLFSNDMEELRKITNSLKSSRYYLRQSNLEDVFLKATGRRLDGQA
jgi:lipooligosaccharide transport system ATP-binding protein